MAISKNTRDRIAGEDVPTGGMVMEHLPADLEYNPSQPRDSHGKWTSGGGGSAPADSTDVGYNWSVPQTISIGTSDPEYLSPKGGGMPEALKGRYPNVERNLGKRLHVVDGDWTYVQAQLRQIEDMGPFVLANLRRSKAEVYVGNRSPVDLDDMEHLRGAQPRGWEAGAKMEDTSGFYEPSTNRVVIGHGRGGGMSLAQHEIGHAITLREKSTYNTDRYKWEDMHERTYGFIRDDYAKQGGPRGYAGVRESMAMAVEEVCYNAKLKQELHRSDNYGFSREWMDAVIQEIAR